MHCQSKAGSCCRWETQGAANNASRARQAKDEWGARSRRQARRRQDFRGRMGCATARGDRDAKHPIDTGTAWGRVHWLEQVMPPRQWQGEAGRAENPRGQIAGRITRGVPRQTRGFARKHVCIRPGQAISWGRTTSTDWEDL